MSGYLPAPYAQNGRSYPRRLPLSLGTLCNRDKFLNTIALGPNLTAALCRTILDVRRIILIQLQAGLMSGRR